MTNTKADRRAAERKEINENLHRQIAGHHHYFATHALGWETGATLEEAIEKLLLRNTDPTWVRNCLKDGVLLPIFTCKVHEQAEKAYKINWFQPVGVETSEKKNVLVTYLTKKAYAYCDDPGDDIQRLTARIKELEADLSYARQFPGIPTPESRHARIAQFEAE